MDNTEKRAFIKARGYEIEEIKSNSKRFIGVLAGEDRFIDEVAIDYKVTKIEPTQWIGDPIKDFGKMTLIDPDEAAKTSIRDIINND